MCLCCCNQTDSRKEKGASFSCPCCKQRTPKLSLNCGLGVWEGLGWLFLAQGPLMWLQTVAEAGRVGEAVLEQLVAGQEFLRVPPGSPSAWATLGFLTASQGQLDGISGFQMDKEKPVSWPFMWSFRNHSGTCTVLKWLQVSHNSTQIQKES